MNRPALFAVICLLSLIGACTDTNLGTSEGQAAPQLGNAVKSNIAAQTVNPLAPTSLRSLVKLIADALCFGPRVVTIAVNLLRTAIRLCRLDVPMCAAVIALLFAAEHKLSFQEIVRAVKGLDPTRIFPQLHDLDGIFSRLDRCHLPAILHYHHRRDAAVGAGGLDSDAGALRGVA